MKKYDKGSLFEGCKVAESIRIAKDRINKTIELKEIIRGFKSFTKKNIMREIGRDFDAILYTH